MSEGSESKIPQMMAQNAKVPTAESELMRAIILRAIEDYNSTGELHDAAVEYLNDEDEEYVFSFVSICRYLGFDPQRTRDGITKADRKISTRRRAA